jgi:glycosyltransferase involved in cell wall biosynthesis
VLWPVSAYLRGYSLPRYSTLTGKLYLSSFALAGRALTRLVPNPFHLIAITQYVRQAIKRVSGLDSSVIYPPVDVSSFSEGLSVPKREKTVLVISRISPEKQIERAIRILKIVNEKDEGWRLTVVGALSPFNTSYYEKLVSLGKGHNVQIRTNLSKQEILEAAASSSVYLHTMPGEHFGISVVEAMASGLIPVVPDSGGPVEFVPKSLRYEREQQAAEIIVGTGSASESFRQTLSRTAEGFSDASFRRNFRDYLHSIGF